MKIKRVFILGAGFSKQVGMPLATDLSSLIFDGKRFKDHEEMQAWLVDFKRRLAVTEGMGSDISRLALNVEQLFDFAKYDVELWRMKQQMSSIGREFGETHWKTADTITTWLGYMEEELWHVIWDQQKKASSNFDPIKQFTHQLSKNDTIVTFNYDTLVETALSMQGQAWNHGLNDHKNGGVAVLKMHGSIDWLLLERRPVTTLEKFIKLFSKSDVNVEEHGHQAPQEEEYYWELWRAKDTTTCDSVVEMDKSGLSNFRYSRGLAGLGSHKPLHRLPGSAPTWFKAFEALRSADEIYVIGFSMSAYDTMTRFHFTSVIHDRHNPPSKVTIIDPNAEQLVETISIVFGRLPTLVPLKAENVDWQSTLGR